MSVAAVLSLVLERQKGFIFSLDSREAVVAILSLLLGKQRVAILSLLLERQGVAILSLDSREARSGHPLPRFKRGKGW